MTHKPGIVVTGASGRMGQMLVRTVSASDRAHLAGCVERTGHPWIGQDIGTAMGGAELGVIVTDDAPEAFARAQAIVDFTAPEHGAQFTPTPQEHPERALAEAARLYSEGSLRLQVEKTFPLTQIAEAQTLSAEGHVTGKLVITIA